MFDKFSFPASSFILWSPSRLHFRTGVIFSLYFSTWGCSYSSRLKSNDVRRRFSALHYYETKKSCYSIKRSYALYPRYHVLECLIIKCNLKKKLKSFTSRIFHRPNQFLLSRLEIVQFLWVMKSKTSRSHLSSITLFKLTSTTFVAPPHILFITSEKLGTFYLDLLRDVLFRHLFLQNWITAKAVFTVYPLLARETTTVAEYSCRANC